MKIRPVAAALAVTLGLMLRGAPADYEGGLAAYRSQDFSEAHTRWRECALGGSARCQYALGVLHDDGRGVPADTFEALVWYERAARQEHPDALMALGFIYATGRGGVVQDAVRAWAWFARAAAAGVPAAADHRERIGQLLTEDERRRGERLADELSIRYHLQK